MSKQDRQGARTAAQLEQKYDWGKTFAEVYGLVSDAQKAAEKALDAVTGLDSELDHEEIFNRLTKNGTVQGIYRGDNDDIYINATYIKSGKLAADRIDTDHLTVKATNVKGELSYGQLPSGIVTETNVTTIVGGIVTTDYVNALGISVAAAKITGLLTANQIKLGGKMSLYQSIDSDISAGYLGYMDVTVSSGSGAGFNGKALGIEASGHAMMLAPQGNLVLASYGDVFLGSSASGVNVLNDELRIAGKAVMDRLTSFERAFNAIGVTFQWAKDY